MAHNRVTALRGIVTASRNYGEGSSFVEAIEIHTAGLDRAELVALIGLLGGVLSMSFDSIQKMAEDAANNICSKGTPHPPP